jgi:hypothetical protein
LESKEQIINTSEISETFQNISYIRNLNNNNDALSFLSYKMSESKRLGSGVDLLSILDNKKEDSLNLSKKTTDKQIRAYRGKRNSIGPTFNIIVNNNTTYNLNRSNNNIFKRRVSLKSSKDNKINNFNIPKKTTVNNSSLFNNNKQNFFKKRSNSFTESGLFFKQFYTLINNSRFFKNKHQILNEIQEKISSMKNNNTLRDLQVEKNLRNNSIFYKLNSKVGKENDEERVNNLRSNENKRIGHKILIKSYTSISIDDNEKTNNVDNGGDVINEFYGDKSSLNFMQNNDNNSVLKKLNKRY